jgi:hypothetical protein
MPKLVSVAPTAIDVARHMTLWRPARGSSQELQGENRLTMKIGIKEPRSAANQMGMISWRSG